MRLCLKTKTKNNKQWDPTKMAHWAQMPEATADRLSSISGTHKWKVKSDSHKSSSGLSTALSPSLPGILRLELVSRLLPRWLLLWVGNQPF